MQRMKAAGGWQVPGEQHVRADGLPPRLQQLQRLRHFHVTQISDWRWRPHATDLRAAQPHQSAGHARRG